MITLWLMFVIALAFATAGTPIARRLAFRLSLVDRPSARKVHTAPIPLLGGLAIDIAVLLAVLLLGKAYLAELGGIVAGGVLVGLVGLWDDRVSLPAWAKMAAQAAAAVLLIATGTRVQLPVPLWLNLALTMLWVVGITNAMNFLDNMDGLTGGVAAIAAAWFCVLSALHGQYLVGAMAAALLGACLGFLRYNAYPASIFMGDTGSLFLGFLLAAIGIKLRFPSNVNFVTWMVPVLVLGLPIFDTTLVVVSRIRRGVNPFTTAGKDHTSHRLTEYGLTHREAVLSLYLICCALGMAALLVTQSNILEGYAVGGATAFIGLWALWRLELRYPRRAPISESPESSTSQSETI